MRRASTQTLEEVSLAKKAKRDAGFGAASRTTGPHHFYRAGPAKIVAPIAASRPLTRSLTQPVTHILRSS
jgi:hypothetical protein